MKRPWIAASVTAFVLVTALATYQLTRPPVRIGLGSEVHFDDWFFSVQKVERTPEGYAAIVRVRSEARRVDFQFHPETVRFSLDGHPVTQTLQESEGGEVPAGETKEFRLLYVAPPSGSLATVKFEAGGLPEFLDEIVGENYEVVARLRP